MKVLVDKDFFGNSNYLVIEDGEFSWTNDATPYHDLRFSTNGKNTLNDYLGLYGVDSFTFIENKYRNMLNAVGARGPNWKHALPTSVYSEKIKDLSVFLKLVGEITGSESYASVFSSGNRILHALVPFSPNQEILKQDVENPTVRSTVASFCPISSGKTAPLTYNRFKTVTGRLVVESGPQVLLLPRSMKNIFKSSYEDGCIVWVDFVSLEPRFAKLMSSSLTKKDIYSDLIQEYGLSHGRSKIKEAVLSTLFGAGIAKLTEIVGREAMVIKKAIDEYFNLEKILEMAGDYRGGKIRNYFGRPIPLKKRSSNVAINNFVQSSSVDVSLVGFSDLMSDTRMPSSVKPLCVIHDALVLDIRNDDIPQLSKIINDGIDIEDVGHFFLEYDIL